MVTTDAIVIGSLKYRDSSLIAHLFTQELGYRSYLLKGILANKKGKIKASYFQPLTHLSAVVSDKNPDQLGYIKECNVLYSPLHQAGEEVKSAVQLFLCELLANILKGESEQNTPLFTYLKTTLGGLDALDQLANFHIKFLLDLTKFLGFYPNTSDMTADYFDVEAGCFTFFTPKGKGLEGQTLSIFKKILGTNFDKAMQIKMTKQQRTEILDTILLYFSFHLQGFYLPKSLPVLHEVFEVF